MQFLALAPQTKWLKHKPEPTQACSAWERTPLLPPEPPLPLVFFLNCRLGLACGYLWLAAADRFWDRHHLGGGWGLWDAQSLSANAARVRISQHSCSPRSVLSVRGSCCKKRS